MKYTKAARDRQSFYRTQGAQYYRRRKGLIPHPANIHECLLCVQHGAECRSWELLLDSVMLSSGSGQKEGRVESVR